MPRHVATQPCSRAAMRPCDHATAPPRPYATTPTHSHHATAMQPPCDSGKNKVQRDGARTGRNRNVPLNMVCLGIADGMSIANIPCAHFLFSFVSTGTSIPAQKTCHRRCRDTRCPTCDGLHVDEAQTGRNRKVSLNMAAKRNGGWNITKMCRKYNLATGTARDGWWEHNRNVS